MKAHVQPRRNRRKPRVKLPAPPGHWIPLGLAVRRIMRQYGLPAATAITIATAAGFNVEVRS
jgi:hypothetical protein